MFGSQAVISNYQAMCYHTEVRGTGVGVAVCINRVGGLLGPVAVGYLTLVHSDPRWIFGLFTISLVIAAGVVSLGRAETAETPADEELRADTGSAGQTIALDQHPSGSR